MLCAAVLMGCGTAVAQRTPPRQSVSPAASTLPGKAPTCQTSQLRFAGIGLLSSMTGEDGFYVMFGNAGSACRLTGYPTVSFADASGPLPFRYQDGTGPYFDASLPKSVTVPGHSARPGVQFEIAKYRCDLGVERGARTVTFRLPGATTDVRLATMTWPGNAHIDYCKGGPKDPGQLVYVNHAQAIESGG